MRRSRCAGAMAADFGAIAPVWMAALLLLLLLASQSVAPAQTGTPPLSLTAGEGIEKTESGYRYDFGPVDRIARPVCARRFKLRNDGASAVTIDRLQASCGCTTALLKAPQDAEGRVLLGAGKTIDFQVTMDLTHQLPGRLAKYLWVFVKDSPAPALTMVLEASVASVVEFTPAALSFGRNDAGAVKSLPLLVTIDRRIADSGLPFELVSSAAGIAVAPREAPAAAAGDRAVRAFTVTLTDRADLGLLNGALSFVVRQEAGASPPDPGRSHLASLLTASVVPVSGEVVGSVSASPGSVVFGAVSASDRNPRRVTLLGKPEALAPLRLEPLNDWITARLLPLEGGAAGSPPLRRLEVALTQKAPTGTLQTQVALRTLEGRRLVLSVSATRSSTRQ